MLVCLYTAMKQPVTQKTRLIECIYNQSAVMLGFIFVRIHSVSPTKSYYCLCQSKRLQGMNTWIIVHWSHKSLLPFLSNVLAINAQQLVSIQVQVNALVYGAECHTKQFECYDETFSMDLLYIVSEDVFYNYIFCFSMHNCCWNLFLDIA